MKRSGLWLSPSQLSVFKDCPRCFWLSKRPDKLERPRGIFPSLPGGMDLVLKTRYDQFREVGGFPPELAEQIPGFKLFGDQAFLDRARNWRTGLSTEIELSFAGAKATLGGAIDDLLVSPSGELAIFDYKTRGSPPKGTGEEYYGHQLDCYSLLVYRAKAGNVASEGMLAYYYPVDTLQGGAGQIHVSFACEVKKIEVSPKRAAELVESAARCLAGPEPEALDSCEYCAYTSRAAALAATLTDPRR